MQHETHRVPVTALAFWNHDVVITGEGGLLRAYSLTTRSLLTSTQIFHGQAIHGLVTHDEDGKVKLLVHGGRKICCVRLARQSASSIELEIGIITKADDWILHAAFCPSTLNDKGNCTAALVTAHNALVRVRFDHNLRLSLEPVVSGSKCILYCAQVIWLSASQCLIASGTAFGDIIVWSCFLRQDDNSLYTSHQTHYAFPAHEGSVFGVELSTPDTAKAVGERQHLLASCSDDRTIRVWDVSDLSRQAPHQAEQQQETGFGTISAQRHGPPLLAKAMGHISRIWHVRFIHRMTQGEVYILSFGEDSQCITWILEATALGEASKAFKLTQLDYQRLHHGKNIWSLAVDESFNVVTGGADGALAWFHFIDAKSLQSRQGQMVQPSNAVAKTGNYRSYAFVGQNSLIATTDQGQLFLLSLDRGSCQASAVSDVLPELRGYSIVASAPGVACIAGAKGTVYSYVEHSSDLKPILTTDRKVAGIFVSDSSSHATDGSSRALDLLMTNVGSAVALYCSVVLSRTEGMITKGNERRLCLPDDFVVTSFASRHLSASDTIVVLGSRNGSIAAYSIGAHVKQLLLPTTVGAGIHGQETVTKLGVLSQDDKAASNNIYLFSTGRDGTFAVHKVQLHTTNATLATEHQLQLPFGPNIEGFGVNDPGRVWVWGFRGKQFVVFDVSTQQEIMSVECGGVHRNWAFQSNNGGGTFVWTKASKLYFATQQHLPHSTANPGGHGREIKCVAVSPVDSRLFATGAEDTNIKLSRYENSSFRCLHTLQKHVTGIQHLQWSADGQHLFSSGGFEEFLIWRITPAIPHLGIGISCESRHPKSGTSDLRILKFDVQDQQQQKSTFHITMVYSDSTIRSWQYQARTWIPLAQGNYLTSCLTQCLRSGADPSNLLTASTDGFLATWVSDSTQKKKKKLAWKRRHRVHQSAILSAVQLDFAGVGRLIVSGGDDNAIGVTLVVESDTFWTLLVPRAHAAAVTALVVVRIGANGFWFASAGIDQRVKLWRVDVDGGKMGGEVVDVKLLGNVFSAVADVSSMEKMQGPDGQEGLLVAGVGLDVWKVPHLED